MSWRRRGRSGVVKQPRFVLIQVLQGLAIDRRVKQKRLLRIKRRVALLGVLLVALRHLLLMVLQWHLLLLLSCTAMVVDISVVWSVSFLRGDSLEIYWIVVVHNEGGGQGGRCRGDEEEVDKVTYSETLFFFIL